MSRIIRKLPDPQPVAAGQTAFLNVPLGLAYHSFLVRYQRGGADATPAQIASDFDEIRIKINGRTMIEATGAQLIDYLEYHGQTVTDGVLPILLTMPWFRTTAGEDSLVWGTADVQQVSIEIDVNAAAVTPDIEMYASMERENRPLGTIRTLKRFTKTVSATGEQDVADVPPRGAFALLDLHFTSGSINTVEVLVNNVIVRELDAAVMTAVAELARPQKVPQTGWFHVDFTETNRITDILGINVEDLRFKVDFGGTGSVPILVSRTETPQLGV